MAAEQRIGPFSATQATLILIVVTFVLRAIGASVLGWGTGEAYYLSSARQLHLSYFDQPPLSLWMTWATLHLTGSENVLVLRLPFIALFAAATWLIYGAGKAIHSPMAGFYAALITNACILFSLSIGSWLQPDAPMIVFWMGTVCVLLHIFFGAGAERPYRFWSLAGLLLGLTFLSKYHAAFIVLGTGVFMVLNGNARHWLKHPAPYLALVIAGVVFLPVVIWNAQNDWVSFGFQGGRALAEPGLHWDRLLRMILGQLLYMVPWLAIPALVIGLRALAVGPRGQFPRRVVPGAAALLSYIAWPPILFFTVVALWSDTQFHFHWQAPGYLMLFILMGAWAAEKRPRGVQIWLFGSALVTLAILGLLVSHSATGWARQVFHGAWEDPTAQQLPWTELGAALTDHGAFQDAKVFVMGTNWIDCGYIDTQVAGRTPLACIGPDPRNLRFNFVPADHQGWNAYIVARTGDADGLIASYGPMFDAIEKLGTVTVSRGGIVELHDIQLFRASGFKGN